MRKTVFYLKLRSNIVLNGDVSLAERELRSFFQSISPALDGDQIQQVIGLPSHIAQLHCRRCKPIGFIATDGKYSLERLIQQLNFIQEIWFEKSNEINHRPWLIEVKHADRIFFCALPLMACGELLTKSRLPRPTAHDVTLLTGFLSGKYTIKPALNPPSNGGTSTQHVHSLHKYKAKFFPRLIRSFIVNNLDSVPKSDEGRIILLDPFVGSGTALVESSLLGFDSVGVDIDKLSCAISQAKIDLLNIDPDEVVKTANQLADVVSRQKPLGSTYRFPKRIAKKFERWGSLAEQRDYEVSITKWKSAINKLANPRTRHLFQICLSDALTRKFVIRMMGTGVGRFALEIAKTHLDTLMTSNIESLIHASFVTKSLLKGYSLQIGKADVRYGTALALPFADRSFSMIVTSPPYLPASSGREDYLVGKAISNVALDIMTDMQIEAAEITSVGSMKSIVDSEDGLPKSVYKLYNWLSQDPLREIKAKPTLSYYISLKKALKENIRVLLPGGLAIYVIGKESVFYKFSTREVLYRVECDKIFAELALSCGFIIEEQIDVELDKKNKNARPRSLDSFFESVFLLRKP